MAGEVIIGGNYRLVEQVGAGAYGIVYRAEPLRGARGMVAVKVFTKDPNEDEMQMLEELEHPNILRYRATLAHEGKLCLVTDFADGGSIADLLKAHAPNGLSSEQVKHIVLATARALAYLHEKNIVHRDVKPANLLMVSSRDGSETRVVLADVGIAKAMDATSGTHTGFQSAAYAAPEMFRGQVGLKSDIYALGVTAYELLAGTPPFTGSPAEVMFGHLEKPVAHVPATTGPWQEALDGMLKKNPIHRLSAEGLIAIIAASPPTPPNQERSAGIAPLEVVATLKKRTLQPGHCNQVNSFAFSPDGFRLVSASWDQTVKLWDAEDGECLMTLKGHSGSVQTIEFSPDGSRLASGSLDKTVKVWDAEDGKCLMTLKEHTRAVTSVAFSPDGFKLASASDDNTIKVWDAENGECLMTLEGHLARVNSVFFSPDGSRLASASCDKTIKVWAAKAGECLMTLERHSGWVNSVAFSPDGSRLASASDDNTIKVWDAENGECLMTLKGHYRSVYSVAFSPDGSRLASASDDKRVKVWDVEDGELLMTLDGHYRSVYSVAFSPDGSRLASASGDKTVKVWDVEDGEHLMTLDGHLNFR